MKTIQLKLRSILTNYNLIVHFNRFHLVIVFINIMRNKVLSILTDNMPQFIEIIGSYKKCYEIKKFILYHYSKVLLILTATFYPSVSCIILKALLSHYVITIFSYLYMMMAVCCYTYYETFHSVGFCLIKRSRMSFQSNDRIYLFFRTLTIKLNCAHKFQIISGMHELLAPGVSILFNTKQNSIIGTHAFSIRYDKFR